MRAGLSGRRVVSMRHCPAWSETGPCAGQSRVAGVCLRQIGRQEADKDKISDEHFNILYEPWASVMED